MFRLFFWGSRKMVSGDVRFSPYFVRSSPNTGHSEAQAGLPLVTRNGHRPDIDTIYQMHSRVTKIK
jgi:hypothetical protein